eukprot:gene7796-9145_t
MEVVVSISSSSSGSGSAPGSSGSSPTLNGNANGSSPLAGSSSMPNMNAQTPEIRFRQHHEFKPDRSSSPFNKTKKRSATLSASTSAPSSVTSSPVISTSHTSSASTSPTMYERGAGERKSAPVGGSSPLPATMPDEKIIDAMFDSLAKERDLPAINWSKEKKWLLLVQHGKLRQDDVPSESRGSGSGGDHSTPEYFINALRNEPPKSLMLSLHVNLRTKTISWLTNFIEMDGISLIFSLLQLKKKEHREECVRAIAILMNSPLGLKAVTTMPIAAKRLAMVLNSSHQFSLKSRAIVIELLTVMCMEKYVPGGYSMVLKALTNLKEKKRFTTFVKFIRENNSLEMKTKALCFINVLIHEPEETGVRVNIRGEFLRLGLYDYLKGIKPTLAPEENLLTQIEIFEEMMEEDNQELEQRLDELKNQLGIDIESLDDVFKAIKSAAGKAGLTKSLLSILQNLLVMKNDPDGVKYWLLCDSLIKQVSMQRSGMGDTNSVDLKSLLANVDTATKEVMLSRKLDELEKQNIDKAASIQEKDISIKSLLDIVKAIKGANGAPLDPVLQRQIDDAIKSLDVPQASPAVAVLPTITEEPKVDIPPPPPPPMMDGGGDGPPPPPPPPPMMGGPGSGPAPPPPPPPPGSKKIAAIKTRPAPTVPKPSHPLKALQWVKLPPVKVNESVFNVLGDMKDVKLPWQEIEQEFAAKVIVREKKVAKPRGPAQVIDGKLGQNISIFLSQFKTASNVDLIRWVQTMDEGKMSREQVRQMSKLLPSKDDMGALKDFLQAEERSRLANADQFCLDIGAFPYAADKINIFMFRADFATRVTEVKPHIAAVGLACDELLKSRRLLRILEIVLVLGNFINYGTNRGDQPGFKIDALIKLADTKSSDLQSNLVHTLVRYCMQQEPSLLTFADELQSLGPAKKVIWSGVVADLASLARDTTMARNTIESLQKVNEPFNESIVPFVEQATTDVDKLRKMLQSTDDNFKKLCIFLGEEPGKMTPDEEQEEKEAKREAQKALRSFVRTFKKTIILRKDFKEDMILV